MKTYINNILVGRKRVVWIANNLRVSPHAELRLLQKDKSTRTLTQRILETPLAWKTKLGRVAIACDLFHYLVIDGNDKDESGKNCATLITLIDLMPTGITVCDVFMQDYKSFNTTNNNGIYTAQNLCKSINNTYRNNEKYDEYIKKSIEGGVYNG